MAEVLAKDAEIGKVYQSPRGVKVKVIEKKEEGLLRVVAESIKTGNRILLPDDYLLIETDAEESAPKTEDKPAETEAAQETTTEAESKPESTSEEVKELTEVKESEKKIRPGRKSRSKGNEEIKQMLLQGMSVSEIAKALGVNYRTVYPKVRKFKAEAERAGMSLEDYLKSIE